MKNAWIARLAALTTLAAALLAGCGAPAEAPVSSLAESTPAPAESQPPASLPQPQPEPAPAEMAEEREDIQDYLPSPDLPAYRPIPIEQKEYQGEFIALTFKDLPATDAETLVADEYYGAAMGGEPGAIAALWLPGPMAPVPLSPEGDPRWQGTEWLRVDKLEELDLAATQAAAQFEGEPLFEPWRREKAPGMDYSAYVEKIYAQGARVVLCEYALQYTEEHRAQGPQLDDGERTEYWLLVPGQDGALRLFDNTRFFGSFALPYFEEFTPAAMLVE